MMPTMICRPPSPNWPFIAAICFILSPHWVRDAVARSWRWSCHAQRRRSRSAKRLRGVCVACRATARCWFRGVPERYVAAANTRGRPASGSFSLVIGGRARARVITQFASALAMRAFLFPTLALKNADIPPILPPFSTALRATTRTWLGPTPPARRWLFP
jgi:hypothetical protein